MLPRTKEKRQPELTLLREGTELFKAVLLEGDLVIIIHAVDADDMDAVAYQQRLAQKAADEPGSTGDEERSYFQNQSYKETSVHIICSLYRIYQTDQTSRVNIMGVFTNGVRVSII